MSPSIRKTTNNPLEHLILFLRGQRVIVDVHLAVIYGVTAKRLREQVRRNIHRFPPDFMFQLGKNELLEVAAICGNLQNLKFSPHLPYVFSEHGTIMLASVLNSQIAVHASVEVVRAFIRLREVLASHHDLAKKLDKLEKHYDAQFEQVFSAIRALIAEPAPPKRKIGFIAAKLCPVPLTPPS